MPSCNSPLILFPVSRARQSSLPRLSSSLLQLSCPWSWSVFIGIRRVIIFFPSSDIQISLPWVKYLPTYLVTSRKFSANLPGFWLPAQSNTHPFKSAQRPSNGGVLAVGALPLLLRKLDMDYNNGFNPPASTFVSGCCLPSIIVTLNWCWNIFTLPYRSYL